MFVTTKFNREWHGVTEVRESVEASLEKLDLDYVDLLLVHWPNPAQGKYVDAWEGMLQLREDGLIKAAGTSNFKPAHIDRLLAATSQAPEVNQIELSPLVTRTGPREYHVRHDIVTQSWSPLGAGNELLTLPVVQRHCEAARQVSSASRAAMACPVWLQHHSQDEYSCARMRENLDIFAFELTDADMQALDELGPR